MSARTYKPTAVVLIVYFTGAAACMEALDAFRSGPVWGLIILGAAAIGTLTWLNGRSLRQAQETIHENHLVVRERELQAKAILDHAADAIITADEYGVIHLFNSAAAQIFGYQEQEILGQNIKTLIPRPYLPEHESYRLQPAPPRQAGDLANPGREVLGRRKNGETFPLELAVSEITREPYRLFIAVARDITRRRQAESDLESSRQQLRSLAARLQAVREEERTRIAREIHDVLGQALTGVKMDLSWIKHHLSDDPGAIGERADQMSELVDSIIQTVRRIATELRPGILDNLGLVAALEWQAEEFHARTTIECRCLSALDERLLPASHQTALFRIFQETLTNVARHAQATRVETNLRLDNDEVWLRIEDNGRGITHEEATSFASLGLLGIRERAAILGGSVDIVGCPGKGTSVSARIPIQSPGRMG